MKISSLATTWLLAATSSAYYLDVYSGNFGAGTKKEFTSDGTHYVGFTVKTWVWGSLTGDGCCVVFCKGVTEKGRYCKSASNQESTAGVDKVVTGCGQFTHLSCEGA